MINDKYNIKNLVSSIYECQKRIVLNRRLINEIQSDDKDAVQLCDENKKLASKIKDLQSELKKKYHFSY